DKAKALSSAGEAIGALLTPEQVEQYAGKNNRDGSTVFSDGKTVNEVTDAHGVTRKFGYGSDGKVNEVTEPSGHWTTDDGVRWTNEKGGTWEGTVEVAPDGTYDSIKPNGEHVIRYTNGSERWIDSKGDVLKEKATDGSVREYTYGKNDKGEDVVDMKVTHLK